MMQEAKIVLVSVTVISVLKWFYITLDASSSCKFSFKRENYEILN